MDETFFAGLEIEDVTLPSGQHVNLPLRYYDETELWGFFPADAAKVQQLMLPGRLKAVEIAPGVAGILLITADAKKVDILGPYKHAVIAVMAAHEMAQTPGGEPTYYVHRFPATVVQQAKIEIWGWPFTLADMSFEDDERMARCRIRADGKDMLTLEVQKLATKVDSWSYDAFTIKGDEILWTRPLLRGERGVSDVKGGASCTLGNHPFAEELRAVGMDSVSIMHGYDREYQMILPRAHARLPLGTKEKAFG